MLAATITILIRIERPVPVCHCDPPQAEKQSLTYAKQVNSLQINKITYTLSSLRDAEGSEAIFDQCQMKKQYYVYILTNFTNSVLYIGVTSNLVRRIYQHKAKLDDGFTSKYKISKLVYYEIFEDVENALLREKRLKGSSRKRKIGLINSINEQWRDLYKDIL